MAKRDVHLVGQKRMNHIVSHVPGVKRSVKKQADKMGRVATKRLNTEAKHRTGDAQIVVSQVDVDAFVSLVDPAALSIEFGHYAGPQSAGMNRTYVPGLHILVDWYHEGLR